MKYNQFFLPLVGVVLLWFFACSSSSSDDWMKNLVDEACKCENTECADKLEKKYEKQFKEWKAAMDKKDEPNKKERDAAMAKAKTEEQRIAIQRKYEEKWEGLMKPYQPLMAKAKKCKEALNTKQ